MFVSDVQSRCHARTRFRRASPTASALRRRYPDKFSGNPPTTRLTPSVTGCRRGADTGVMSRATFGGGGVGGGCCCCCCFDGRIRVSTYAGLVRLWCDSVMLKRRRVCSRGRGPWAFVKHELTANVRSHVVPVGVLRNRFFFHLTRPSVLAPPGATGQSGVGGLDRPAAGYNLAGGSPSDPATARGDKEPKWLGLPAAMGRYQAAALGSGHRGPGAVEPQATGESKDECLTLW